MRDYIVEMIATSKKQMIVTAESAEEVGKAVELIIKNTNMVTFNNEDVACIEVEIAPKEETDYADCDVHIDEIDMNKKWKNNQV